MGNCQSFVTLLVTLTCLNSVLNVCICRYVALLSGLDLGSKKDNLFDLQLMVDLVTGQLGDEDQQDATSKVVRVIIAGNSLSEETQDKEQLSKVSKTFVLPVLGYRKCFILTCIFPV